MAMNTRLPCPSREKDALGNEPKGGTLAGSFSSDKTEHKDRKKRSKGRGRLLSGKGNHLFLSLLSVSLYMIVTFSFFPQLY